MFKELENIIKSIEGNVLTISLDDKLMQYIYNNNRINVYSITDNRPLKSSLKKSKKRKINNGKSINIKKLRKYINDKSVNYLFCNMNSVIDYYKYFIRDSIYLSKNKIFIYADNKIDSEFIIDKYKRYNVEIVYNKYKNGYMLEITTIKAKNNKLNDKIYFIKDTLYNMAEFIGNLLVT